MFGFQISGFEFRSRGLGSDFGVSGFRFWVSGLGFRDSSFGVWISGVGLQGYLAHTTPPPVGPYSSRTYGDRMGAGVSSERGK